MVEGSRRIIKICSDEIARHDRLDELKSHLLSCQHPSQTINDAFWRLFSPCRTVEENEYLIFTRTHNPTQSPNIEKIQNCLSDLKHPEMIKAFKNKKPLCTTRQPKNLKKMLVKAKFEMKPSIPKEPRKIGLYPCGSCKFCRLGYIQYATELVLYHRKRPIKWVYTRSFSCDSLGILYVIKCRTCPENYIGKAVAVKSRISKHTSDVRIPANSNCKKCTDHLRDHSNLIEPYFYFFPFFYVEEPGLRHFMETRFRIRWKPSLNTF